MSLAAAVLVLEESLLGWRAVEQMVPAVELAVAAAFAAVAARTVEVRTGLPFAVVAAVFRLDEGTCDEPFCRHGSCGGLGRLERRAENLSSSDTAVSR